MPQDFTLSQLEKSILEAKNKGYVFLSCFQYYELKACGKLPEKFVVCRVDIDWSCRKGKLLGDLFRQTGISASFFIRLHGDEYNPFSFENYLIVKELIKDGFEIGYHSEIVDQSMIWAEDAADCLKRDIRVMESMYGIKLHGIASHGGNTQFNNLDFWKDKKASDFGLCYEAYDQQASFGLFYESLYISDSNFSWKCYLNGVRQAENSKSFLHHLDAGPSHIYLTLHPECYYNRHIYE